MVTFLLNVIVVVLLFEIFRLYFYIIFSNLCADIFIKVSVSAVITWSYAKRRFFYFLFFYPVYVVCVSF